MSLSFLNNSGGTAKLFEKGKWPTGSQKSEDFLMFSGVIKKWVKSLDICGLILKIFLL